MAITPMFFKQIEKFQCLKLSTAQGPDHGTLRIHVSRVQKHVSKQSFLTFNFSLFPSLNSDPTQTSLFEPFWTPDRLHCLSHSGH